MPSRSEITSFQLASYISCDLEHYLGIEEVSIRFLEVQERKVFIPLELDKRSFALK